MIIKSHIRGGYRAAADYLKEVGKNEQIRLVQISDPDAKNLDEAFQNMWGIGCNSRAKKPLLHFSINPHIQDRRLTDDEALMIAQDFMQRCNQIVGDHQFVIVEHIKKGRQHFHVAVCRISLTTGKAVDPGKYHNAKMNCARAMEKKLGLKSPFSPNEKELNSAKDLKRSMDEIDKIIHTAFTAAKDGKEFVNLASKEGFAILKGRPNKKGELTILAQDKKGGIYRVTASLMRSDISFRKQRLTKKFGPDIDGLATYQPKRRTRIVLPHIARRGTLSRPSVRDFASRPPRHYAGMLGETLHTHPTEGGNSSGKGKGDKTGKGDGSGGGAASTASALKSNPKSRTPPVKKY